MKPTSGAGSLGYQYDGAWQAIGFVLRTEGWRGMYRGLWPNLCTSVYIRKKTKSDIRRDWIVKVAPSIATSFFTYELVKDFLISMP